MAGSADRPSAIIHAFPKRGRFAVPEARGEPRPVPEDKDAKVAVAAFDNWYHEAAVQEAARARKH
jgi:hypothetical protein